MNAAIARLIRRPISTKLFPNHFSYQGLIRPLRSGAQCHSGGCRVFLSSSISDNVTSATAPTSTDVTQKTSSDGVVGLPIDFDVASKIEGNESQIVTITLQPGQVLRAESGAMMYMTDGVVMETTTGGGLSSGFQRMLTGQNFFISDYRYEGDSTGTVALGTDFPSKIIRLNVSEYGGKLICQKGALLCASHTIDVTMEYSKNFTTGFFGGEGFILQGLTGEGDVFLKGGGTIIRRDLKENEQLRISSGCLVAFSNGVDYGASLVTPCCRDPLSLWSNVQIVVCFDSHNACSFFSFFKTRCTNGARICQCVCWWRRFVHDNVDGSWRGMVARTTSPTHD
jgi:uncharacterized protein (TIGR00266 family)